MNFEEYEKKWQSLYRELAEAVRFIINQAILARDDLPRPQSIQAREKSLKSLRGKLEQRELLDSPKIEDEIRDLAGVRPIFYTDSDVERFKKSDIIRANFAIEDVRVHHPTVENEGRQYRGIHYTVRLTPERETLPEYAKFAGMRCEIQVQTILNHAWSETTHDILYKRPDSEGFGKRAFASIERRLKRVMGEYLLPAGREMARAQYDYERAMAGKELFDRDALELLRTSADNNERYDLLQNFLEYVIPNYDDLPTMFPEIKEALQDAVKKARETLTKPIETPFGSYDGKTADEIIRLAIRILEECGYADVVGTFEVLLEIYRDTTGSDRRKQALTVLQRLAKYHIPVVQRVGYSVQRALVEELAKRTPELAEYPAVAITVWTQVLRTEMMGTEFAGDTMTISTGTVYPHASLSEVRRMAADGLLGLLDTPISEGAQREILSALNDSTLLPHQETYTDELCKIVLAGSIHVLRQIAPRIPSLSYELREAFEDDLLRQYRRVLDLAASERFDESVRGNARAVAGAIIAVRDKINLDEDFVIYKTLVGFETVLPPHWEDDQFYKGAEAYRLERADEFIEAISDWNIDRWRVRIARCASTKSNDLATFPVFGEFLTRLAERKSWAVKPLLAGGDPDLVKFMPALLLGLSRSSDCVGYQELIDACVGDPTRRTALMRHYRVVRPETVDPVTALLELAVRDHDIFSMIEGVVLAIEYHDDTTFPLKVGVFVPGLRALTADRDTRWIHGTRFLPRARARSFFQGLLAAEAQAVLTNMLDLESVEYHAEQILAYIAHVHPDLVWSFFHTRLNRRGEDRPDNPIPYQFFGLEKELGRDADLAVSTVYSWFDEAAPLFRFEGARLLHNVFPDLTEPFTAALIRLLQTEGSRGINFVLPILENYTADVGLQDVAKEIAASLPSDDGRLGSLTIALMNTGVTTGQFGRAEALRERRDRVANWSIDPRPAVREFARLFCERIAISIAEEQRRAEEEGEFRRLGYEDPADEDPS
jgi:ppGpp synthetase/RelA/SpoT-type nucleotidyltranferase